MGHQPFAVRGLEPRQARRAQVYADQVFGDLLLDCREQGYRYSAVMAAWLVYAC
jgi:hypothetical protein